MGSQSILSIPAVVGPEQRFPVQPCNRVWMPPYAIENGVAVLNGDGQLAVRFARDEQPQPWALLNGYVNSVQQPITEIFVRVLVAGASGRNLLLATGTGLGIGYASADGLAPQVTPDPYRYLPGGPPPP